MATSRIKHFIRVCKEQKLRVLLFTASVTIALIGMFGFSDRLTYFARKQKVVFDRSQQKSKNYRIVRDERAESYARADALMQLAVYEEKDAFSIAREWIQSTDRELVLGAIGTLKLSREKSDEEILYGMYSGLDRHPENLVYRDALVRSLLGKPMALGSLYKMVELPWTKRVEALRIYGAIYQSEVESSRKEKVLAYLKKFLITKDSDLRTQALLSLSEVSPNDPDVVGALRNTVESEDPALLSYAALHLAKVRDEWIIKNYKKLLQSESSDAQIAGLKVIPVLCLKDSLGELERLFFRADDLQTKALIVGAAVQINSDSSKEFLKKALEDKTLSPEGRQILFNKISQASSSKEFDCK